MLGRRILFAKTSSWFSFLLILIVFALVLSGCLSGIIDTGENGKNPFNVFRGVWKNTNIPGVGTVEIAINEPVEGGYNEAELAENQFFKGSVTCSNFSNGYLDIVDFHLSIDDTYFYIWATIAKEIEDNPLKPGSYLAVRVWEEVDSVRNDFKLDGSLEDNDSLKVTSLRIIQKGQEIYNLKDDHNTEYLIFEKQR